MKIGVFTVLLANKPLEEALDYLKDLGVEAVGIAENFVIEEDIPATSV